MNLWHFLRMAKWARRPPSAQRVKLVLVVLSIAVLIVAIEKLGLWPDALTLGDRPRFRLRP